MGKAVSIRTGKNKRSAWQSYAAIGKAVSIYNDGSQNNITRQLGVKHKIRNFYNNIIDPNSPDGDITIDTHAVAAALMKALSSSSKQVAHNFGGGGVGSSNAKGVQGTYYAYVEAYRMAAKELNLQPRQLQSIVWEAVRGLYTDTYKTDAENVKNIDNIWDTYAQGNITINEARNEAVKKAGGINDPVWSKEIEQQSGSKRDNEPVGRERSGGRRDSRDDVGNDIGGGRRQKLAAATTNGETITTDTEHTLFKGMLSKMKNGKRFSVHNIKKGKFAALDKKLANDYKGDKPLKQFTMPAGTTVQVVKLDTKEGADAFRRKEEQAIDASDAQVVKLITLDARGKSEQYIIKDRDIVRSAKDVVETKRPISKEDAIASQPMSKRRRAIIERAKAKEAAQTPSARKQIIGENAELSQNVRDNLSVARQMENAKESAKKIRIATGWERGVDGKWRYEIEDINVLSKIDDKFVKGKLSDIRKGSDIFRLEALIGENSIIFKYYPELKRADIQFSDKVTEGFEVISDYIGLAIKNNIYISPSRTKD
jgi:hypothetical protein